MCVCVLCLCKHPDSREDEWVMGMHGGSAGAWNRWTERNVLKNSQAHLIYESLASLSPPPFSGIQVRTQDFCLFTHPLLGTAASHLSCPGAAVLTLINGTFPPGRGPESPSAALGHGPPRLPCR